MLRHFGIYCLLSHVILWAANKGTLFLQPSEICHSDFFRFRIKPENVFFKALGRTFETGIDVFQSSYRVLKSCNWAIRIITSSRGTVIGVSESEIHHEVSQLACLGILNFQTCWNSTSK